MCSCSYKSHSGDFEIGHQQASKTEVIKCRLSPRDWKLWAYAPPTTFEVIRRFPFPFSSFACGFLAFACFQISNAGSRPPFPSLFSHHLAHTRILTILHLPPHLLVASKQPLPLRLHRIITLHSSSNSVGHQIRLKGLPRLHHKRLAHHC